MQRTKIVLKLQIKFGRSGMSNIPASPTGKTGLPASLTLLFYIVQEDSAEFLLAIWIT